MDEELASLGYVADDVSSLVKIRQCLLALGYEEYQIGSGHCLREMPKNVMDKGEFVEKLDSLQKEVDSLFGKCKKLQEEKESLLIVLKETHLTETVKVQATKRLIEQNSQNMTKAVNAHVNLIQQVNHMLWTVRPVANLEEIRKACDRLLCKYTLKLLEDAREKTSKI